MNTVAQTPTQATSQISVIGFPQLNLSQNTANSTSTGSQPFAKLLNGLASVGMNHPQNADTASTQTADAVDSKTESGSQDSISLNAAMLSSLGSNLEQELIKILQQVAPQMSQASQEKSSSSGNVNYCSNLIALLLNLTQINGNSADTANADSGKQVSNGDTSSDLIAKIEQEMSLLLGGGVVSTVTGNTASSSFNPVSNGETQSSVNHEVSEFAKKLANDPVLNADLQKLASALSGNSSATGYSAALEELISQMQNLGSNSGGATQQMALNVASANSSAAGSSGKALSDTIAQSLPNAVLSDAQAAAQNGYPNTVSEGSQQQSGQAQAASVGTGSKNGNSVVVSGPVNEADLQKLVSAMSANPSDSNLSSVLEKLFPVMKNVKLDTAGNIQQAVQNATTSTSSTMGSSGSSLNDIIVQNVQGTTSSSASSSGNSLNDIVVQSVHRNASSAAGSSGSSLNDIIVQALQNVVSSDAKASLQNTNAKGASEGSGPSPAQVQVASIETGSSGNSAAASTSAASSAMVTSSSSASPSNQTANKADAAAGNQGSQVIAVSSSTDKQDSSKSDASLNDSVNRNITEIYPSVADGTKVNSSFNQTLSAVVQNQSPTDGRPNAFQIAQSIVREVDMMNQDGKTVVNLKLEPESLGSVVLRVASEDGKLSAEFNVKSPDARVFLESSIPQMKQMLQTNGVSLAHLTVSLSGGESEAKSRSGQYRSKKQQQKFYLDTSTDSAEAARSFGYNTMEIKV